MQNDIAIKIDHVSKDFKLPHEKVNSVKSIAVNFHRRKKSYEMQHALKDISFEIKKGEFFGIVGRNGSGKSTLLKLLANIYVPTSGNVQVNGQLTPFIELGVGFNMELSGRENVFLNGALLGFSRKEMAAMYNDIVDFAELEKFMDQKLKNYSSGMQVRLAFSIAIRAQSDILLLDEVLAVGDAAFQQKCYNYFEELKRKNHTVVFVSHDMGAVRRFCTRAIYIKDGKITHQGSVSDIAEVYVKENIDSSPSPKKNSEQASQVSSRIVDEKSHHITLELAYEAKSKEEMYIGISVVKDGVSVAEITTSPKSPLVGKGTVRYILDTSIFNAGVYDITAALFKLKNRELIGLSNSASKFVITGEDITKGAALKLADTWDYDN